MSNGNAALAVTNTGGALSSLFGGMAQADSLRTQGEIAERANKLNAEFAELQAEDALSRGDIALDRQGRAARKILGSQRARLAAQGISIDSGSALDAQIATGALAQEDAVMIRSNAFREALGFKSQAQGYKYAATIARASGDQQAQQTLLTAGVRALEYGGKAAGNYADYRKDKAPYPSTSPDAGRSYAPKSKPSLRKGVDAQGWPVYS
jgi:hypothetical protein